MDILELFRKELPATDEEAKELTKDYPHKRNEVTKEILMAKLKSVRNKFRQVSVANSWLPTIFPVYLSYCDLDRISHSQIVFYGYYACLIKYVF